jgi:hypothetical protein
MTRAATPAPGARDPRVDPKKGDVLKTRRYERTVHEPDPRFGIPQAVVMFYDQEGFLDWRDYRMWRKWAKKAEVLHAAD